jgi:excisionase family DNA binding protein
VTAATCDDVLDGGLVKISEAAEMLRLSRSKVYQLMDAGQIPYLKMGKNRRIARQSLTDYVKRSMVGSVVPVVI